MSMFKDVNVVYHYVTDLEAAKKFYTDLLGWPVAYDSPEAGWFEVGEPGKTHVALNKRTPGDPGTAGVGATITFTVDSADKTQAWLKQKGIKCDELMLIPGSMKLGTFYDPEGNRMHFVESVPPSAR